VGDAEFSVTVVADQLRAFGLDVVCAADPRGGCQQLTEGKPCQAVFLILSSARDGRCLDEAQQLAQLCTIRDVPFAVIVPEDPECATCAEEKLHAERGLTLPVLHEELASCLARMFRAHGDLEPTWSGRVNIPAPGMAGIRVLLAEDSQANRLIMAEILRRGGFEVDTVGDGAEAVEAVRSLPYDVVLMDLDMPVMDGLAATRQIRGLPGDAGKIPIVALTAHAMEDTREQIGEAGLSDFLTKPVDRETLFARIVHWARGAGMTTTAPSDGGTEAGDILVDREVLGQLGRDTSPELVPRLVDVFMREFRDRVGRLSAGAEAADLSALGREAHALKSSAATYGAVAVADWARVLDSACKEADRTAAVQAARRIIDLTEATAEAYAAILAG
jgi:CheY-like chemotaxis protein